MTSTQTNPVADSAAPAMPLRLQNPDRREGAAGENLVGKRLHRDVGHEAVILSDRRLPDTGGKIDHLVVARSGVWVIDAKCWTGQITYKYAGGLFAPIWKLTVDGRDCTYLTDDIYGQVIRVAQVLKDPADVHAAVVFAHGDWGTAATMRFLLGRPYRHLGVWITWAAALAHIIDKAGPLTPEKIASVGHTLDKALPPR